MRRLHFTIAFMAGLWATNDLSAQPQPQSMSRPSFSPYLNLLRGSGGGSPALNYFGLVRPQIQFNQQANMLQQQINQSNQTLSGLSNQVQGSDPSLPITGRGASFGFYSHYYPTLGGGGGGGGVGIGGGAGGRIGGIGSFGGAGIGSLGGGAIGQSPQGRLSQGGGIGGGRGAAPGIPGVGRGR